MMKWDVFWGSLLQGVIGGLIIVVAVTVCVAVFVLPFIWLYNKIDK